MKNKINLKFLMVIFITVSFITNLQAGGKKNDKHLVGTWWGSEKDEQIKGVLVKWIQQRFSDGKLITTFTYVFEDGSEDISIEKGKWWVKDGKFFEKSDDSKKPDIYYYEVIDQDHILFKAYKLSNIFENKDYNFIDTRVENDSLYIQIED